MISHVTCRLVCRHCDKPRGRQAYVVPFYPRYNFLYFAAVAYPEIFFGRGGVQQIQLRTEDRQDGDLGAVAP